MRPILLRLQVATDADPMAVGLLCDALAEYVEARDQYLADGLTYDSKRVEKDNDDGSTTVSIMKRAHPAVGIAADAWRRAKVMLTEFGLTAASRAKVSVADPGPADPLEAWERGRGASS